MYLRILNESIKDMFIPNEQEKQNVFTFWKQQHPNGTMEDFESDYKEWRYQHGRDTLTDNAVDYVNFAKENPMAATMNLANKKMQLMWASSLPGIGIAAGALNRGIDKAGQWVHDKVYAAPQYIWDHLPKGVTDTLSTPITMPTMAGATAAGSSLLGKAAAAGSAIAGKTAALAGSAASAIGASGVGGFAGLTGVAGGAAAGGAVALPALVAYSYVNKMDELNDKIANAEDLGSKHNTNIAVLEKIISNPHMPRETKEELLNNAYFTNSQKERLLNSPIMDYGDKFAQLQHYLTSTPGGNLTAAALIGAGLAGVYYLYNKFIKGKKINDSDINKAQKIDNKK